MGVRVDFEVEATVEMLPACLAGIRLLTSVDSHVDQQTVAAGEMFPAGFAGVRLLAGVRSHVDGQIAALAEPFPACCAGVRPLARVDPVMSLHLRLVFENFSAESAFYWLFTCNSVAVIHITVTVTSVSELFLPS